MRSSSTEILRGLRWKPDGVRPEADLRAPEGLARASIEEEDLDAPLLDDPRQLPVIGRQGWVEPISQGLAAFAGRSEA